MELRLLGTGDAIGTPKIRCACPQCMEAYRTGEQRLRTSLLLEVDGRHLLIDTSPDLRQQLLCAGSPVIDAVIWTHGHYDHFMGFGEFYRVQDPPPVYGAPEVLRYCGDTFSFLSFEKHPVTPFEPFELFGLRITLFPVNHPPAYTTGLRIEHQGTVICYTADTRADLDPASRALLAGADLLLIDGIVPPGYHLHKHMNYEEACRIAEESGAKEFRCVHLSHMIPFDLAHTGHDGEMFRF